MEGKGESNLEKILYLYNNCQSRTREEILYDIYLEEWKLKGLTQKEMDKIINSKEPTLKENINYINKVFNTDISYVQVSENRWEYIINDSGYLAPLNPGSRLNYDECVVALSILAQPFKFMPTELSRIKKHLMDDIQNEEEKKELENLDLRRIGIIKKDFDKSTTTNNTEAHNEIYAQKRYINNYHKIRRAIINNVEIFYKLVDEGGNLLNGTPIQICSTVGGVAYPQLYVEIKDRKENSTNIILKDIEAVYYKEDVEKKAAEMSINELLNVEKTTNNTSNLRVLVKIQKSPRSFRLIREMKPLKNVEILEDNGAVWLIKLESNGFDGVETFKTWVMTFGEDAEVLEPQELRDSIKESAEKIKKMYGNIKLVQ